MNDFFNLIKSLFDSSSKIGKWILAIIIALIGLYFASCSTSRNVSVRVDKADKVDIHVKDSTTVANPFL